ncbi:MAG TPA: hypothetical protein VF263_03115 [Longimicrobiaceae bacterium]
MNGGTFRTSRNGGSIGSGGRSPGIAGVRAARILGLAVLAFPLASPGPALAQDPHPCIAFVDNARALMTSYTDQLTILTDGTAGAKLKASQDRTLSLVAEFERLETACKGAVGGVPGNPRVLAALLNAQPRDMWWTLQLWRGSGSKTTERFRVSAQEWRVSFEGAFESAAVAAGGVSVTVYDARGRAVARGTLGGPGADITHVQAGPGTYYIEISAANMNYEIRVAEWRRLGPERDRP